MIMRKSGVRELCAAVVLSGLVLVGCDEVNSAVEQVEATGDKAAVCAEALQIVDLSVNVDPETVASGAEEKARQLQELAQRVADQSVQETLFDIANGYLELERKKIDHLSDFSAWLERNLGRLDELRRACL